nr:hypothetical protein CFP56_57901 [Quercus suber]
MLSADIPYDLTTPGQLYALSHRWADSVLRLPGDVPATGPSKVSIPGYHIGSEGRSDDFLTALFGNMDYAKYAVPIPKATPQGFPTTLEVLLIDAMESWVRKDHGIARIDPCGSQRLARAD